MADGKPCTGCLPPVHGLVKLLRATETTTGVVVETLRIDTGKSDPLRRSVEPGSSGAGECFTWDRTAVRKEIDPSQTGVSAATTAPPALAPTPQRASGASAAITGLDAVSCSAAAEDADHVAIDVEPPEGHLPEKARDQTPSSPSAGGAAESSRDCSCS